jgi:glycosyltransferase involved in cell wall biosynthesis
MTASSKSGCYLLSIIIPTYNYAKAVRVAVSSVLEQINEVCELIVIDDGSQDETSTVLAAITPPPTVQCRFIRQENAGPAAARNHGLQLATGKFILFLDADDELLPGAVDAVIKAIKAHPEAGLILGAHIDRLPNGRERLVPPTPICGDISQRVSDYLFRKRISIQHGACVFCRTLLERRPYPERLRQTEDIPVFAYLVAHAIPILVQQPLARINKHSGSLRHNPAYAKASHQMLIEELFSSLPEESQQLRAAYEAKRTLSVSGFATRLVISKVPAATTEWRGLLIGGKPYAGST